MDLLPYFLCRYVPDSTSRMAHSFLCICRPIVSNTCSTGLKNSVPERTQRQTQPAQHCRSTSQSRLRTQAMHYSGYSKGVKSELRQNIYGFSLGGPVQIPKLYNWQRNHQTFFFASDEFWSKTTGASRTTNVITAAMRGGNLSGSRGLPPGGLSLTPTGQQLLAAEGKTNCIASPTTLNPACLDPDAAAILKDRK